MVFTILLICARCHVMERESFESEETARLMNEHFVNIKVDKEERSDVDRVYMTYVQVHKHAPAFLACPMLNLKGNAALCACMEILAAAGSVIHCSEVSGVHMLQSWPCGRPPAAAAAGP
jgi:hypothetical protein